MSNAPGTNISRHEAIGFAAVGKVLGVDIQLADDNGQNSFPDGKWETRSQTGVIEVTALPDKEHMSCWAAKNRSGESYIESGSAPVGHGKLHLWIQKFLAEEWAKANFGKLTAQQAEVRHLYLHAYSTHFHEMLSRLSDTFETAPRECVDILELPDGIDAIWFEGRASYVTDRPGKFRLNLARFSSRHGWKRYEVVVDEFELPPAENPPGLK